MFETTDGRYLAHLGHPEYEGERLAFEWNRDRALGRTDVEPPVSFDADAPETTWRGHRDAVVAGFVARAALETGERAWRARDLSEARGARSA
jgi:homoserine O-succinyltransferase